MRGIAVVDRQLDAGQIAVWNTSRDGDRATNVNAVVIDANNDPGATEKVLSLVHRCVVLRTEGTTLEGLPIEGEALDVADIAALLDEVEAQQSRILDAIADYKRAIRSRTLIAPTFPSRPSPEDFSPAEDTPSLRALTTANYFARAWTTWLETDEQRRRRTVQPVTGTSPWIMPESMNAATVPDFPASFTDRLYVQGIG
ncbi:hypothetical protein [uncultured Serinicoccus sp.]|uniref:hypothetical protein n=1 Tax=uncultured Serinicoccus sp. TaxID=735514 RepID=UPI00260CEFC1|nr:hypothetical protein [uncultured Serinicoccus sp.]